MYSSKMLSYVSLHTCEMMLIVTAVFSDWSQFECCLGYGK